MTSTRPDVFLSYSREDQATARRYAEALQREGFQVWWDQTLSTGEAYDAVTEKALEDARAVVVLWSKASVMSRWVRAEATTADRNGVLMPVMTGACKRPVMFELTQTADLSHWRGDANDPAWRAFVADLKRLVLRGQPPESWGLLGTTPVAPAGVPLAGRGSGPRRQPAVLIGAAVAAIAIIAAGAWAWSHQSRVKQARASLPEIPVLVDAGDFPAAFARAQAVRRYLPDDPMLKSLAPLYTLIYSVSTTPSGAEVQVRRYEGVDDAWQNLGTTPLTNVELPRQAMRWRVAKEGFATLEFATTALAYQDAAGGFLQNTGGKLELNLMKSTEVPEGMVFVPAGGSPVISQLPPRPVPSFFIDRNEVTNAQFKEFVDAGGYERRTWWEGLDLSRDGKPLAFEQAMRLFVDSTGRPGPASWELGSYPEGRGEYPVSGVSWYEAAAYARFRGKSLPTAYHWFRAAMPVDDFVSSLAASSAPLSNFGTEASAPVGRFQGVGPYGTRDMFGNVREWLFNTESGRGWLTGGSWEDPIYNYNLLAASPLLERAGVNGFRLMQGAGDETDGAPLRAAIEPNAGVRKVSLAKPVGDEAFATLVSQYQYRPGPLNPTPPEVMATTEAWTKQRVTIDTGYEGKRMDVILFVPRDARPPLQPVILFSGMQTFLFPASRDSIEPGFAALPLDYIVRSGRVLVSPILEGSFERFKAPVDFNDPVRLARESIAWRIDIGRTIDYLETRTDIDARQVGFVGISFGASVGLPVLATEPRLKAAVLISGGIPPQDTYPPLSDPVNFAPRIRLPVLMVNGRYDPVFTVDGSQEPLYRLLGTPAADKRHVILEFGHASPPRGEVLRETLGWYDKYLGPVTR